MEFTTRWSCNPKQLDSSRAGRTTQSPRHRRDCHPPWCPVPRDFSPGRAWRRFCRLQFGAPNRRADSKCELFPLQSPLLGESPLVSFPPLNYMLKSSGYSCLISDPISGFLHVSYKTPRFCILVVQQGGGRSARHTTTFTPHRRHHAYRRCSEHLPSRSCYATTQYTS